jgi:malate synthase
VLGDRPNQWEKQRDGKLRPKDWLNFQPEQPITEAGLRNNINVGIHYLGSWLAGNGCVPIHNLMEDAATAEIPARRSGSGWSRRRACSTTAAR